MSIASAKTRRLSMLARTRDGVRRIEGKVPDKAFLEYLRTRASRKVPRMSRPLEEGGPREREAPEKMELSFWEGPSKEKWKLMALNKTWGGLFATILRLVSVFLDVYCFPFVRRRATSVYSEIYIKFGLLLLFLFPLVASTIVWGPSLLKGMTPFDHVMVWMETLVWGFCGFYFWLSTGLIVGGFRMRKGRSFSMAWLPYYRPIPAMRAAPSFSFGDVLLTLKDCHTSFVAFGSIGSGKTASVMIPTMVQFFRKLNNPDHSAVDARWGGLVLDVKGDFIDFIIWGLRLANRPITDLVIIDPEVDLIRYNPLDSSDKRKFADKGAAMLVAVQKILDGSASSKDPFWDKTSQSVIRSTLKTLQVVKPIEDISLADVGRYCRSDERMEMLLQEAEERLERDRHQLSEEDYFGFMSDVGKLKDEWVNLSENTKSILKTTISQMLGPMVSSQMLQRVFCRDTNFSFEDVINKGKIVLFRGSNLDRDTARLIAVCLKMDFQTWTKRRNGNQAKAFRLNTDRTVLFVADEYQEYVTGGGEGDEAYFAVSRSAKVCGLVATQHFTSLKVTLKDEDQAKLLVSNLCTKIFLSGVDEATATIGEFYGSKGEVEQASSTVDTGAFGQIGGRSGSNQTSSLNVSKQLKEFFRKDTFSSLQTFDMEKIPIPKSHFIRRNGKKIIKPGCKIGPWHSEAVIYNYNRWEKGDTKMEQTKLFHFYPDRGQMAELSSHYDKLLLDRNCQRQVIGRAMMLLADVESQTEQKFEEFRTFGRNVEHLRKTMSESILVDKDHEEGSKQDQAAKVEIALKHARDILKEMEDNGQADSRGYAMQKKREADLLRKQNTLYIAIKLEEDSERISVGGMHSSELDDLLESTMSRQIEGNDLEALDFGEVGFDELPESPLDDEIDGFASGEAAHQDSDSGHTEMDRPDLRSIEELEAEMETFVGVEDFGGTEDDPAFESIPEVVRPSEGDEDAPELPDPDPLPSSGEEPESLSGLEVEDVPDESLESVVESDDAFESIEPDYSEEDVEEPEHEVIEAEETVEPDHDGEGPAGSSK